MSIFQKLIQALGAMFTHFWQYVIAVYTAEEHQIMADAVPVVEKIALALQNEQPTLGGANFVAALTMAAIPVLEQEGLVLLHTATAAVAASVARDLNVQNTNNGGVLAGGIQS